MSDTILNLKLTCGCVFSPCGVPCNIYLHISASFQPTDARVYTFCLVFMIPSKYLSYLSVVIIMALCLLSVVVPCNWLTLQGPKIYTGIITLSLFGVSLQPFSPSAFQETWHWIISKASGFLLGLALAHSYEFKFLFPIKLKDFYTQHGKYKCKSKECEVPYRYFDSVKCQSCIFEIRIF